MVLIEPRLQLHRSGSKGLGPALVVTNLRALSAWFNATSACIVFIKLFVPQSPESRHEFIVPPLRFVVASIATM